MAETGFGEKRSRHPLWLLLSDDQRRDMLALAGTPPPPSPAPVPVGAFEGREEIARIMRERPRRWREGEA